MMMTIMMMIMNLETRREMLEKCLTSNLMLDLFCCICVFVMLACFATCFRLGIWELRLIGERWGYNGIVGFANCPSLLSVFFVCKTTKVVKL